MGEQRTSWGSCLICRRVWWRGAERGGCGMGNLGIPRLASCLMPRILGQCIEPV
ncbi:hypothetical protein F383_08520 [Gossypium arboreum]|uniref:Uncharacterized protein n=1 Tax=Gossypium arboreum TaxID=29729 RepID=A0A0B0P4G1_GOSAR|nr:hypothetical protein F383_08520 [Gossypium arboreum]